MKSKLLLAGLLGSALLMGAFDCHAASWVLNDVDVPNKNVKANYYDADNVKTHAKSLYWTEKFELTDFGTAAYTKHLAQFPICQKNIAAKGPVTHHQLDFEIKDGKFRTIGKRNYTKDEKLVCSDKDMNNELDTKWQEVVYKSPMYERYYLLATKYKFAY